MTNTGRDEIKHENVNVPKDSEPKKEVRPFKERAEALEEQIKQLIEEHERLSDIVDKLKIINTLLHKEVCKEYSFTKLPKKEDQ
ncbi:hypothetical protein NEHOM01_1826 [Nematocida homosporus]|uniref:uncharacterized protein n=1 Tax=Nematocida homosporus TaxID=1912981 RepID=UPI00221E7617|nr:uncharacterized protein NEHOM01_1826 [Nematocida homosporus]KAI5186968.1 hypothetical protein NEHOM01_1826 [Nematocida homosporus]